MKPLRLAVVGGGVAGIFAARTLRHASPAAELVLLEADSCLGGKVRTIRDAGLLMEDGPNSLMSARAPSELPDLIGAMGPSSADESELSVLSAPRGSERWVYNRNSLRRLPSFGVLSTAGWLRLLAEPLIKFSPVESLQELLEQRFGAEAGGLAAELMSAGVYAGDPRRLDATDAFPRLARLSNSRRSLILSLLQTAVKGARSKPAAPGLWTVAGGLSAWLGKVAQPLRDQVRLNSAVKELRPFAAQPITSSLPSVGWELGALGRFDGVVLAVPSYIAAELLKPVESELARRLGTIRYAAVTVCHTVYRDEDFSVVPRGFGALVASPNIAVLGTLFPSQLFAGRATPGHQLLTSMVGGARHPELAALPDDRLKTQVEGDLRTLFGTRGPSTYFRPVRWSEAIPQVEVGHAARIGFVRQRLQSLPPLTLAGAAFDGVSVPAVARSGIDAAHALLTRMRM